MTDPTDKTRPDDAPQTLPTPVSAVVLPSPPVREPVHIEASPSEPHSAQTADPEPPPSHRPHRPDTRYIAFVNQKGGVGKTTTTVNLGAALARSGQRVLLIDMDPQAHLTLHMGIEAGPATKTVYHLLTDAGVSALDIAQQAGENLVVLPAEVNLAGIDSELAPLASTGQAQRVLARKCAPLLADADSKPAFDYVLIDCPPSLGLLTINALAMANEVVVPMQTHFLALQGLSKLLETVTLIKGAVNPGLAVTGIVLCMHDAQTILAGEILSDLQAFLEAAREHDVPWRNAVVFHPPVRRNIKLAECPSFGKTIFDYAPQCPGAGDYLDLAKALIRQRQPAR